MSTRTIEAGTLSPASQLAASNTVHFPNESAEYRTARNALLGRKSSCAASSNAWRPSGVRCHNATSGK
ncbi:MAG TPA: hypothetical protein VN901_25250 [Candidatus Acidoferrales bacterium]|nr:hypothetical protein [Candidatus Acidoferrales bacterium]